MSQDKDIVIQMGTEKEATVTILHGNAPNPIQPYVLEGFVHDVSSAESFVKYLLKYGTKENTVVFAGDRKVTAIIDQSVVERDVDYLNYRMSINMYFSEFCKYLQKPMDQKTAVKFLEKFKEFLGPNVNDLMELVQHIKYTQKISVEGKSTDDDEIACMKINNTDVTVVVPKEVIVQMPIYNGGDVVEFPMTIDVLKPTNSDQKLGMIFGITFKEAVIEKAYQKEFEKIQEGLRGWLVLESKVD